MQRWPQKLKRSIHNQLDVTTSPLQSKKSIKEESSSKDLHSKHLILRKYDLPPVLPAVLSLCKPHAAVIKKLDVSFSIADFQVLDSLCTHLVDLRILYAKSCGLSSEVDASNVISWPRKLEELDLSRNELRQCPGGISQLLYLSKLNLSGNFIKSVSPDILRIPSLKRCLLLNNPVRNIPKHICREGVQEMRGYLAIEPLPMPKETPPHGELNKELSTAGSSNSNSGGAMSLENCSDLRRYVLRNQSSFESGYESNQRHHSSSSFSSTASTDTDLSEASDVEYDFSITSWPAFDCKEVPEGYVKGQKNQLCQVFLPEECTQEVEISEVKDMSLHPRLRDNELLITPVVRITPHGLTFRSKPAIIILSHCTRRCRVQSPNFVPLCSSTKQYQRPRWEAIGQLGQACQLYEDCVMFSTFHFSLFTVVASYPYPTAALEMRPGVEGHLLIPELPGFGVHFSHECLLGESGDEAVTIRGTVYYCDQSYRARDSRALASACVGIEPHGMAFKSPVHVSIPIPDYTDILSQFPETNLELWCSRECDFNGIPQNWKRMDDTDVWLENSEDDGTKLARFETSHFSWYEFLWTLCSAPLQKLGLGAFSIYSHLASRSRYLAVRFQAFMSHPRGKSCTFGLVVTVYKFGDPLTTPSNYPLLVADSGAKRMYLRTGDLHVRVEGSFTANKDIREMLERKGKLLDFTGEDFCERFEFALDLKGDILLPLQEGQVLGKLRFIQWEGSDPIHKSYNLIVPPSNLQAGTQTTDTMSPGNPSAPQAVGFQRNLGSPSSMGFQTLADFTPPRSPEPAEQDWSCGTASNTSTPTSHHSSAASSSVHHWIRKRARRDSSTPPPQACTPKRPNLVRLNSDSDDEITDKTLMKISHKCGGKFMELGISLGLDYQVIANRTSRLEGRPEHLKAFEVLQEWKARDPSYQVLAQALEGIGMNNTALKYCYTRE